MAREGLRDRATIKPPKRLIDEVESPSKRRRVTRAQPAAPAGAPAVIAAPMVPLAPIPHIQLHAPTPSPSATSSSPSLSVSESDHTNSPNDSQKRTEDDDWPVEEEEEELHSSNEYGSEQESDQDDACDTEGSKAPTLPRGPLEWRIVTASPAPGAVSAQWNDLPAELHTMIYPESGYKKILKRIPGSKRPERNDLFDAMVVLFVIDSGVQFTSRVAHPAVRELEREYNKAHNHELKLFVHWDCVDQIRPLLRLIKQAVFATIAWIEQHGDVDPEGWHEQAINAPILEYLRRDAALGGDIVLPLLEREALEDLLEVAIQGYIYTSPPFQPLPLTVNVILPERTEFVPPPHSELYGLLSAPFNDPASGIHWRWPDPRTVWSVIEHASVENPTFPVITLATIEDDILYDQFYETFDSLPPVPRVPYLSGAHVLTDGDAIVPLVSERGFCDYLFAKDRRVYGAHVAAQAAAARL